MARDLWSSKPMPSRHPAASLWLSCASKHSLDDEYSDLSLASAADDGEGREPRTLRHPTVYSKVKVILSYSEAQYFSK